MKRAEFLRLSAFSLVGWMGSQGFRAYMLQSDELLEYFARLRTLIIEYCGINLSPYFYSQRAEGYQHYLYISEADKVKLPEEESYFRYYGSNEEQALKQQEIKKAAGYHTLLYKTAATSSAMVFSPLERYDRVSLSFIALHEAHHIHRRNQKYTRIPYSMEEAAGDVLGNMVSEEWAIRYPDLFAVSEAVNQRKLNEWLYERINETRSRLDAGKPREKEFRQLSEALETKLEHADLFKKDRFLYPVNNAYFIRYGYYTKHYFLLKKLYKAAGNPKEFLAILDTLPESEEEAVLKIEGILKKWG